jgi:hypothetical protein
MSPLGCARSPLADGKGDLCIDQQFRNGECAIPSCWDCANAPEALESRSHPPNDAQARGQCDARSEFPANMSRVLRPQTSSTSVHAPSPRRHANYAGADWTGSAFAPQGISKSKIYRESLSRHCFEKEANHKKLKKESSQNGLQILRHVTRAFKFQRATSQFLQVSEVFWHSQ